MPIFIHLLLWLSGWMVLPFADAVQSLVRHGSERAADDTGGVAEARRVAAERAETERLFAAAPHWQAMSVAERERFHDFNAIYTRARNDGDDDAAWAAAEAFIKEAAPSELRTNTAILLAKHWEDADRKGEAVALLESVEPGTPGYRRAALALGGMIEWQNGGKDLEPILENFRAPNQKVLRGGLALHDHYTVARLLASSGEHERARLYYFAAAPDGADRAGVRQYLVNGNALARDLQLRGRPAEALNFQLNLMRKYPVAVGSGALRDGVARARGAGADEAADALVQLMRDNFADTRDAANLEDAEAADALLRGNREDAIVHLRRLADHPVATDEQRESAAKRLRMLGVRDAPADPRALVPVPDPAFRGDG